MSSSGSGDDEVTEHIELHTIHVPVQCEYSTGSVEQPIIVQDAPLAPSSLQVNSLVYCLF